ncbi:2-C-methyl-D-erythritol 4-phosphate cytidylyltransferase [Colwellia chukchiensis]|uniref:2-C-methyl-D-erythritol 4-phosphate cytidylyltransferase n=1 Tax=Colwellia chukchiensis TaxID=641665 RepID=A0A1H7TZD1_9GAMM|nr:2-C-methyl-D-erythritol 4-phosphate cytidylyltransferase [Colwellia chukchiensis]SEL89327.1 2-C-methyl-D-erythritol 4-phosphate cytidylyltransferase [Colwellia chukchiensis]
MLNLAEKFCVVVPAAGVGKRMLTSCPKQYLTIANHTILEHTVQRLLSHEAIANVVIVLSAQDEYFATTSLANNQAVRTVIGGKERVDSVLAGLKSLDAAQQPWVLVHDAARPCVRHQDISRLIQYCLANDHGGILAMPVRDTMKQSQCGQKIAKTLVRSQMWHALTPQMFKTTELIQAISAALANNITITDESSAMEAFGYSSGLVNASGDNIKITQPEDLQLAEFILNQQKINLSSGALCE